MRSKETERGLFETVSHKLEVVKCVEGQPSSDWLPSVRSACSHGYSRDTIKTMYRGISARDKSGGYRDYRGGRDECAAPRGYARTSEDRSNTTSFRSAWHTASLCESEGRFMRSSGVSRIILLSGSRSLTACVCQARSSTAPPPV